EAGLERRLGLLLERLARVIERGVVGAAKLLVGQIRGARHRSVASPLVWDRRRAKLGNELAPHLTNTRAGRDDPAPWPRRLELNDLEVLLLRRLDHRALLFHPGADLRLDVLEHLFALAGTRVTRELDLVGFLPRLLGEEELRFADGSQHLRQSTNALVL